jgi:hypothetical protein
MKKLAWLAATVALTAATTAARAQSDYGTSTTTTRDPNTGTVTTDSTTVRDGNTVTTESENMPMTTPSTTGTSTTGTSTQGVVIDPMHDQFAATAIPPPRGDDQLYAHTHTYRSHVGSGVGIGVMVGGGFNNFTQQAVRDRTDLGGGWDGTLVFGTRSIFALEASYIGTINDLNSIGLSSNAKLFGTGVSGVGRLNFTRAALQPYLLGGAGWKHYAISGERFNVSGIRNDDNVVEIPMGGGLAFHAKGLMLDARGTYNYAINSSLFDNTIGTGSNGALHNWGARVSLGFEL